MSYFILPVLHSFINGQFINSAKNESEFLAFTCLYLFTMESHLKSALTLVEPGLKKDERIVWVLKKLCSRVGGKVKGDSLELNMLIKVKPP